MNEYLEKLSAERCVNLEVRNTANVATIFKYDGDYHGQSMYFTRYFRIPNHILLKEINCQKAREWILQTYSESITDCCFSRRYESRKGFYYTIVCFFLFDDLLVYLREWESEALFFYRKTDSALVNKIVDEIITFKKGDNQSRIQLLVKDDRLRTKSMTISTPSFSIEDNYNDDFLPVHQMILERLAKENDKGLVLLHGKPGTGKTSYIRYLVTMTKKSVIFLPPNMAASITDPD